MAEKQITCGHCGIQFSQSGRGRPRKYCSKGCLWIGAARANGVRPIEEVNRERKEAALKTCERCGTKFLKRNGSNVWRFCSRSCAHTERKPRQPKPTIERKCVDCGMELSGRVSRCGPCAAIHMRAQSLAHSMAKHDDSPRDCKECGVTFRPVYGDKRKAYCSKVCSAKANKRTARLKGKAKKRAATVEPVNPTRVFMRDGWRCHLCGGMTDKTKRGSLHPNAPELDHIVPLSKGGEHSYRNTACAHKKCNAAKSDTILGQPSLLVA